MTICVYVFSLRVCLVVSQIGNDINTSVTMKVFEQNNEKTCSKPVQPYVGNGDTTTNIDVTYMSYCLWLHPVGISERAWVGGVWWGGGKCIGFLLDCY